jgi:hypothetical protein
MLIPVITHPTAAEMLIQAIIQPVQAAMYPAADAMIQRPRIPTKIVQATATETTSGIWMIWIIIINNCFKKGRVSMRRTLKDSFRKVRALRARESREVLMLLSFFLPFFYFYPYIRLLSLL